MLALYVATIFLSAALLFVLQPLYARKVLPLLGGSPAVWNTALVFYQATLLAGYGYAHLLSRRLAPRLQAAVHAVVLALPLVALPLALRGGLSQPPGSSPVSWVLGLLVTGVGLPFFVVSTSGPLLQRWFARTGHAQAHDPYFLYAASNLGSMLGLLGYPLLVEPNLTGPEQSLWWSAGYVLLAALTIACGIVMMRRATPRGATESPAAHAAPLPWSRVVRWVVLAFVPSSLMMGVTTHLTSDVGSLPLLWVLPLAIYLVTFTLAFSQRPIVPRWLVLRLLPALLVLVTLVLASRANEPFAFILGLDFAVLFAVAYVFHGMLADDRPETEHLTAFYFWLAVGGVLGGTFNALVAPVLFRSVLEYPLVIVLATVLCPPFRGGENPSRANVLDFVLPVAAGALTIGLREFTRAMGMAGTPAALLIVFAVPAFVAYTFSRRPLRFGLAIASILVVTLPWDPSGGRVLTEQRSFFGVHRVVETRGGKHLLLHGSTFHGLQWIAPERRMEPIAYYHRLGPFGQVFPVVEARSDSLRVGFVGLGCGGLLAWARPGETWTAYEIDPLVETIARDRRWYTFVGDAAVKPRIVLGDGRIELLADRDARYDLLILDAYSSDAMPVHLITREAVGVYLGRLAPGGVLVFNISNRHFDLRPLIASLAESYGLVARVRTDVDVKPAEYSEGRFPARIAVLARDSTDLGELARDARWETPVAPPKFRVWTDDYSSILSVLDRSRPR